MAGTDDDCVVVRHVPHRSPARIDVAGSVDTTSGYAVAFGRSSDSVSYTHLDRFDKAVCLESDWFWTTIVKGFVAPWKPEADSQNRVVVRSFAATAAAMAEGGYAVVLDGIIGPWNLEIATAEFDSRHVLSLIHI